MTRRAHIFAILFGKLLRRNLLDPIDAVRACQWLLLHAEKDGFVQGLCALLLSSGDKVLKGDQKKLENTISLRNLLKNTRMKMESYGDKYAEQLVSSSERYREPNAYFVSREGSAAGDRFSYRGICRGPSAKEASKTTQPKTASFRLMFTPTSQISPVYILWPERSEIYPKS